MGFPKRKGFTTILTPAPEEGKVVSIIEFHGRIIIACEYAVYSFDGDKTEKIQLVSAPRPDDT